MLVNYKEIIAVFTQVIVHFLMHRDVWRREAKGGCEEGHPRRAHTPPASLTGGIASAGARSEPRKHADVTWTHRTVEAVCNVCGVAGGEGGGLDAATATTPSTYRQGV